MEEKGKHAWFDLPKLSLPPKKSDCIVPRVGMEFFTKISAQAPK